jgi:hypothetical protein
MVAEASTASVPSAHVTVLFWTVQLPCDATADASVTPAGSVFVTTTPVATAGPLFCARSDQVNGVPNATWSADSVISRKRSAPCPAVGTVTHAENSDTLPSPELAVAVTIWPAAAANRGIPAFPFASVKAPSCPRNVCPSPFPEPSQAAFP